MIIRLTENINSVCGKYEAAKGEELEAFDYDERLAIYHCNKKIIGFASDNKIRYEVCKESAEVVQEQKPAGKKLEVVTYNNETNKLEYPTPNLDMKLPKEWPIKTGTEPQIERNGQKIKLIRALMSNCGQCKASDNLVLDIIHTDNEKQIYLCKGPFSEAVTYDVPFSYGELMQDEKPQQEKPNIKFPNGFVVSSLPSDTEQDYKGDSIQETLAAREVNYGRFADQAELSQQFKNIAHSAAKWDELPADMKESIDMICHKMARVLNGKGAEYADNWHDIAGYATLVEDRLNEL